MNKAKAILITVGIVSIIMSAVGIFYNMMTLSMDFSDAIEEMEILHFNPAFYTMSAICIGCYIVLLICGIQFIRLRTGRLKLFIDLCIYELLFFLAIGPIGLIPEIGLNITAAAGVATGGLAFQLLLLFPFWTPLLAAWAGRRLNAAC